MKINSPRSAKEQQLLDHIKAVNEKKQELEHEANILHVKGKLDECVRKRRAVEEAKRYLYKLCAEHRKKYRKKKS